MTRIIAGTHRGRRLQAPAGEDTRPTSDRVREGLFSSVQSLMELEDARVLELCAGSGALGLEARSRGAGPVTLVERDPAALAAIRANAALLGEDVQVEAVDVMTFLARAPQPYDLVLVDPPYASGVQHLLDALVPWVLPGGLVVLERATRGEQPSWPEGLVALRSRRYGDTTVHYAEPGSRVVDRMPLGSAPMDGKVGPS